MKLPVYAKVGLRPVKAVGTPDGGTAVFAFDWESGDMKLDASWLSQLIHHHDETEFLSEEEFEKKLAAARASSKAARGQG